MRCVRHADDDATRYPERVMRSSAPLVALVVALALAPACGGGETDVTRAPPATPAPLDTSAKIDPFVGTGGKAFDHGACFVGATRPNGMAKLGPDTSGPDGDINFHHYSGYYFPDDKVKAFSHMHLHGTGATDYGLVGVLPLTGFDPAKRTGTANLAPFDKTSEVAAPGFYGLTFLDGVRAELTATPHVGVHRYTFPPGSTRGVLLDLSHHLAGGKVSGIELTIEPGARRLEGKLHSVGGMSGGFGGYDLFFVIESRGGFSHLAWGGDEAPSPAPEVQGDAAGAWLTFDADTVELAVGLSLVDLDGARKNLAAEHPSFDFERDRADAALAWQRLTDRVRPMGGTEADRTTTKTAVYHLFMMPSAVSDVDGRFTGPDGKIHQADGFRMMTDLSLWDTYRTLNPMLDLIAPEVSLDIVRSLHTFATIAGYYPKWSVAQGDSGTMLGASAEIVLADAWVKGIRGWDGADAYARARAAAADPIAPPGGRGGRGDVEPYMDYGYVTSDRGRSVSQTLEYAHDDFALGEFARALGRGDDAAMFDARRKGYEKLWDPGSRAFRAKSAAGVLAHPDDPPIQFTDEYAESNGLQMVWMVPHDPDGLAALFGGREAAVSALEDFFAKSKEDWDDLGPNDIQKHTLRPYYAAANEPVIHVPFLFAQLGRPELAGRWARWAMRTYYAPTPDGLPGNDDGGTMSAWWIFAAMGIYPLPGSDRYILSAPLFPRMELDVPGGVLTIVGDGAGPDAFVPISVALDGAKIADATLRHADLGPGRTVTFTLAAPTK